MGLYNVYELAYAVQVALLQEEAILITSQPGEEIDFIKNSHCLYECPSISGDDSYCFLARYFDTKPVFTFKVTRENFSIELLQKMLINMPTYEGACLSICSYKCNEDLVKFDGSFEHWCELREAILNLEDVPYPLSSFEEQWNSIASELDFDEGEKPPFDRWKTVEDVSSYLNEQDAEYNLEQGTEYNLNRVILKGLRINGILSQIYPNYDNQIPNSFESKFQELQERLDTPAGLVARSILNNLQHTGYAESDEPVETSFFKLGVLSESEYLANKDLLKDIISICSEINSPKRRFLLAYEHPARKSYYHVTAKESVESIMKSGFRLDKDSYNDMGDGIYVVPTDNEQGIINLSNWVLDNIYSNNCRIPAERYSLLQVTCKGTILEGLYDLSHVGYAVISDPTTIESIQEVSLTNLIQQEIFDFPI